MTRSLLIISRSAPQTAHAREALNAALSAASLDQVVHLLFLGQGVQQLTANTATPEFSRYLKQLELFDGITLFAPVESLPDGQATLLPVQRLPAQALQTWLHQYDTVLNYA